MAVAKITSYEHRIEDSKIGALGSEGGRER